MIKSWLIPTSTPEKLLMDYAATSNQKYLSLLVAQFNLSLFHFLLSLSNKELAEDILQMTWLKVMKVAGKDYTHTNVKSWLFTIARNTLIDELRQQQKWQWQTLDDDLVHTTNLSKEFDQADQLTKFNEAITMLPFHQRETFIFQQEGFSVIEICELTDESFETVKSRLRYARNNLKTLLGTRS
jgi:RNA polymerase sigma factor (sigma-70 family)